MVFFLFANNILETSEVSWNILCENQTCPFDQIILPTYQSLLRFCFCCGEVFFLIVMFVKSILENAYR